MEQARVCPICDTSNALDALHCEVCGERLDAEEVESGDAASELSSDGGEVVGFAIESEPYDAPEFDVSDPPTAEELSPATVDVDFSDVVEVDEAPPEPAVTEDSPVVAQIAAEEAAAAAEEAAGEEDAAAREAALEAEFAALQAQFEAEDGEGVEEDPDVLYSPMDGTAYPRGSAEYEEGFGPNGEQLVATPPASTTEASEPSYDEPADEASFGAEPSGASMDDAALAAATAPAQHVSAEFQRSFQAKPKPRPTMQPLPTPGKFVDPATLTVYVNRQPVHRLAIEMDEVLIGRRDPMADAYPDLDLTEFDPSAHISRKHAYVYRQNKNYTLYAISNAGTQLNSDLLELGDRRPLKDGDVIILAGKIAMKFELPNH